MPAPWLLGLRLLQPDPARYLVWATQRSRFAAISSGSAIRMPLRYPGIPHVGVSMPHMVETVPVGAASHRWRSRNARPSAGRSLLDWPL